ncbi:hypothetical protein ACTMP8_23820 [Escherichia coli]|jgi:hypothetical protein|uniref:hypothetical protein n=1 Tax=Escherichia coli TaxID=562 RepID=UPI003F8AA09C
MRIEVAVTHDELVMMNFETPRELEDQLRDQIENGVSLADGRAGVEWIAHYELEVQVIDLE